MPSGEGEQPAARLENLRLPAARRARRGGGGAVPPPTVRPLRTGPAGGVRRRLGARGAGAPPHRGPPRADRLGHRPQHLPRHPVRPLPSTPIAAASTAASTATRGRHHAYLGLSPGLDFESRLFTKPERHGCWSGRSPRRATGRRRSRSATATDPYQPIEREHRLTRAVLEEVLAKARHPVGITTKSDLILRDLDLIAAMAADNLVLVAISLPTLDPVLARRLDPRAPRRIDVSPPCGPCRRRGCPVMVNVSPIIPGLTDHEIETCWRWPVPTGRAGSATPCCACRGK